MDHLRSRLQQLATSLIDPLVGLLARAGLTPNAVTIGGLLICVAAAGCLAGGFLIAAGAVWLLGSALDMFDGALARRTGTVNPAGAFLDSSLDRISEGLMLTAAVYHFAARDTSVAAALAAYALLASFMVSYTRARAEGLGVECTTGLATRAERVILLGAGLLLDLLLMAVGLLALLATFTSIQRLLHVRTALAESGPSQKAP